MIGESLAMILERAIMPAKRERLILAPLGQLSIEECSNEQLRGDRCAQFQVWIHQRSKV